MKERPILFSAPMVLAILEGRKTQTRRVVRFRPKRAELPGPLTGVRDLGLSVCPYGAPGDRLWVREAFSYWYGTKGPPCWYWADGNPESGDYTKPKPSIHMPRWACRLELEITEIRAQQLQQITEEDARAEGVEPSEHESKISAIQSGRFEGRPHVAAFCALWAKINGRRDGCSWDANPWVWVVTFRRVRG